MPPPARRTVAASAVLDALPEAMALALLAAVPAFLNLGTERIFEEEKALLVRAGGLLVLAGLLFRTGLPSTVLRQPIVASGAAVTLAFAVATAWAIAPREAVAGAYYRAFGLATWLGLVVLFVALCAAARTPAGRERVMTAAILGSVWPAAYALLQTAGLDPIDWAGTIPGRAGSTSGNPLLLAGYLVVVMPLTALRAWRVPAYGAVLAVQAAALLTTGSRGPVLALGAAAAVGMAAWLWQPGRRAAITAVLLAAVAVAALLVFVPASRPAFLAERLNASTGSGRVRVLIWNGIGDLMPQGGLRLWIGHGHESLRRLFPPYYVAEIGRIEQTEAMPDRAHNELLDTLVSAGILGVVGLVVFFGAVMAGALRLDDRLLRAGLAAAAVAHLAEIQLGIATMSSRLAFAAVAAMVVAAHVPRPAPPRDAERGPSAAIGGIALGAAAGALSPAMSAAAFRSSPTAATPLLYLAMLAAALAVARAIAARGHADDSLWPRVAVLSAAVVACVPVAATPSRADGYAKAGRELAQAGRVSEAIVAYEEAVRLQPGQDAYLTALGRVLIQQAQPLEGTARETQLRRAGAALGAAARLNPQDPHAPRNLATLARIRARTAPVPVRERLLAEADRRYAHATELAPGMPALWAEWANVDAERQRFDAALVKLDHATTLDPTQVGPWLLRGQIYLAHRRPREALEAYEEALRQRPGDEGAALGRAAALAALGAN